MIIFRTRISTWSLNMAKVVFVHYKKPSTDILLLCATSYFHIWVLNDCPLQNPSQHVLWLLVWYYMNVEHFIYGFNVYGGHSFPCTYILLLIHLFTFDKRELTSRSFNFVIIFCNCINILDTGFFLLCLCGGYQIAIFFLRQYYNIVQLHNMISKWLQMSSLYPNIIQQL
jgi:hypothetical protein